MKKIPNILIATLCIALLLLSGCQNNTENSTLTVGYSALRISLPVFVAQEKGYFAEEGLNVELERFDTAQPLMNALVAGTVDVAGYTALPITYNAMARSNTELYFLTSMIEDQEHRISYLIVPKETSKSFTVSDLEGKSIGILPTVAYRVWMEEILKHHDVPLESVELVPIAPALQPSALESGQVDALFTNDPAATTVIQKDIGRLLSDEVEVPLLFEEPFIFGSFNIRKDFAEENPVVAEKVRKAMDKAVVFVNEHPEEAKQIMETYLHESQQAYVEFYPNALYQTSTETTVSDFQRISEAYINIGIMENSLSVENFIVSDTTFV